MLKDVDMALTLVWDEAVFPWIPIYNSHPTYSIRGITLAAHKGGFKNSQMQEDNWMLMIKKQR